jgi:hypothetical protein
MLAIVVLAVNASGCALLVGAGAGAAGYAYLNGDLEKSYPGTVGRVWPCVKQTIEDMQMPVLSESVDELGGRLESRTADGRRVHIELEAKPAVTVVRVRVGTIGDRDASHKILDRIDERLPTSESRPVAQAF